VLFILRSKKTTKFIFTREETPGNKISTLKTGDGELIITALEI
jgi:hypothetical protein